MPRRRRRLNVTGLSAVVAVVALTLAPARGLAQSTIPEAGTDFLQPTLEGDSANPPKFRKPGEIARTANGRPVVPGRFSNMAPSRIGATPLFGSPPAFGAGDTGFDSTNDPRRKSRASAQNPKLNVATAPPVTTFVPVRPASGAVAKKVRAKALLLRAPEVHPARAAVRPGAILPPPPQPLPLSNPPAEVHPQIAASRPGAVLPVPPPVVTASTSEGSASSPPPGAPPPNTLPIGTPGPALRRLPVSDSDPYEPLGIRAGTFLLRPAIEVSTGYDNNPSRLPGGAGSSFLVVAPELTVRSDWSRHALNADIRGSYTEYGGNFTPSLNRPYLDSRIDGRVDVTHDTHLDLENRFLVSTDNPGSPNLQAGLAKLPINTTLGGTFGITHQFNRLEISAKGTVDRTQYQDSSLTDGSKSSNTDRDFNQYAGIFRAGYELTPGLKPFVEVSRDTRIHDQEFDRSGLQRDSDGTSARAGSAFELSRTLTGELAVGYLVRTYKDPSLPDIKGTIADGSLVWQASALTTAKLLAASTVSESVLTGVSGAFSRDVSVEVDHAFRRWLIGTVKGGYGRDIYVGSDRTDNRYFASVGIAYKLNRDMQIRAELRRDWLNSTISTADYTATAFLVGLRLQR